MPSHAFARLLARHLTPIHAVSRLLTPSPQVITIMRGAAKPSSNKRDLVIAFFLVWICYASMGVSASICPPLQVQFLIYTHLNGVL